MNEMTMNSACMYDEVEGIRSLNKVEGFDPRKYMRLIQNEGQAGKYYLDVAYRKLWFRLRYPEGKIVKKILKLTEQVAIVEARVYLDRNDHEDNFISNALAQKYMSADGQFGNKFVELAETAAVGRALSDAGFGLQFADREGDMDPEVTEAPFDPQMIAGAGGALPEGTYMDSALQEGAAGDGEVLQEEAFPGQYGIEEYIPMPEEVGQAMGMPPAMHQAGAAPAASRQAAQGTAPTAAGQAAQGTAPAAARQAAQGTAPAAAQPQQHAQAQQPVQGMPPAMQNRQAAPNPTQGGRAAVNAGRQAAQKAGNAAGNTAAAKGANAQAAGSIR
ncbi:MAG: hypothetical protein K2P16_06520, partial [Lawsonibacter sp.]|nr:hypothetical protein [Lawsonibacter sp.]